MNNAQTIEKLNNMKLWGFIEALDEQKISSQYSDLSFDERLGFLVDREYLRRENNKLNRRIKSAKLKQSSTFEEIDFHAKRSLKKSQIAELNQASWVRQMQNIIVTGATGVGKTFISCALADSACKKGYSSCYIKTSQLISELKLALVEASIHKTYSKFAKLKLLVIDEWLREPLKDDEARLILDLLDDRFQVSSTMLISQLPVKDWHQQIRDHTIADAILDRAS